MSLFKKIAVGVSTVALPASMFFGTAAVTKAATAGGVYSTPDGTVWFVTKDMQKRAFTSAGAFLSYGFLNFSQVMPADASVTALPSGAFIAPADGKIFCATQTKDTDVAGECALITGSKKAAFVSAAVFAAQGHSFARAMSGDSSFLAKTANIDNGAAAHLPGVLVNNNGTVQMVVTGGLWGIPSQDVFNSWGYNYADVVPANSADTAKSQIGVIPGRMAGELVPTGNAGGGSTGGSVACTDDGTEGTVDDYSVGSPDDSTVSEDQSDVELVAFDVDVANDGDLCMDRFDLYMGETNGGNESSKPWDYFTDVHLLVNGEEVDSMSVDSSSDWTEYDTGTLATTSQEYRLRFTGLDAGLAENETSTVSVAFDTANTIDSADADAIWEFGTTTDSFRFTDGTGFTFTGGEDLASSFSFETADTAALKIQAATDNPDASIIEVSDTADTNAAEIGMFDIKETNGVDVNISEMTVGLTTSDTITDVVRTLYLYDGDTKVGQENVTSGTVTFDNIDLDVDADSTVTLSVQADLKDTNDQVRYQDGDTVSVSSVDLTAYTDASDNDETDFTETGSYAGNTHTLYVNGITVELVSDPTTTVIDDGDGTTFVSGVEFQWVVDITAFGDSDVYINKDVADIVTSSTAGDVDQLYSVEKSGGADLASSSGTIVRSSGPSTDATGDDTAYGAAYNGETFFKIAPGTTHRFTITVSGTNQTNAKQIRALLNDIEWTIDDVTSATAQDGSTADINSYTVGLGSDAATPFKLIQ